MDGWVEVQHEFFARMFLGPVGNVLLKRQRLLQFRSTSWDRTSSGGAPSDDLKALPPFRHACH